MEPESPPAQANERGLADAPSENASGKPSVGHAYERFKYLLKHGFNPIGLAWIALSVAMFVVEALAIAGIGASVFIGGATDFAGVGMATAVFGGMGMFLAVSALFMLWEALFRPMRMVALEGPESVGTVKNALSLASEKLPKIAGFILVAGLVGAVVWGGSMALWFGALTASGEAGLGLLGLLGFIAAGVAAVVIGFLIQPVMYILATTDLGIWASLERSVSLTLDHLGFFLVGYGVIFIGSMSLSCGLAVLQGLLQLVPVLGQLLSLALSAVSGLIMGYFAWLARGALFVTADEAEGGLDFNLEDW